MKPKLKNAIPVLAKLAADHAAREMSEHEAMPRKLGREDRRCWYLLTIERRRENTVSAHLIGRGIRVYVPEQPKWTPRGRTKQREPMFPGYAFARIDYENEWPRVRSRPGVIGVLKDAKTGLPIVVRESDLVRVTDIERAALDTRKRSSFAVGDRVRVRDGSPWSDLDGPIWRLAEKDRIVVLLHVLGRRVKVELPEREIEAI
ncbi:MAG: transcription termination/antitermination protein NusG [Pseudorhodoplanes sp.]|uniref:transcription termination/antitermination protein NusG n=1 Tax=Pseudorhodoplanes sp. TaxID=1934341 RepID=UPI003D097C5D